MLLLKGTLPTSSNMSKAVAPLLVLLCSLWSWPLLGQEETRSVGEHPWAVMAQMAPNFGNGLSQYSLGAERRLFGAPTKVYQVGLTAGAQYHNVDFFGVEEGFGVFGAAHVLLGRNHMFELNAGGSYVSWRRFLDSGWPLLSVGYRRVTPDGVIFKTGIGTFGVYVGFGFVLK